MKLFDAFSQTGYHSTIVTTFGVDFSAYEHIVLPRLTQAGSTNNLLLADERMLGLSLLDGVSRPKWAGQKYSVLGVPSNGQGVFHPKVILQLGQNGGRLLVASANITASGLAGNLEVVGEVVFDGSVPEVAQILCSALAFLSAFIDKQSIAGKQIDWAAARTPWLLDRNRHTPLLDVEGSHIVGVLTTGQEESIGRQFVDLVGGRRVKRLIVASPYWDKNLSSLRALKKTLRPLTTSVLIQKNRGLFPVHSLSSKDKLSVHDIDLVSSTNTSRFAHAKVFIAETDDVDCILFGSANCTDAALGFSARGAINHEVSVYKELPTGEAVQILGMRDALSQELDLDDIATYQEEEQIPLDEMDTRLAGRIELHGDILQWWPANSIVSDKAVFSFTNREGMHIDAALEKTGYSGGCARFKYIGTDVPMFAHVVAAGITYAPVIIVVSAKIRNEQYRISTKSGKTVVNEFKHNYLRPGLWLLDAIQRIESFEAREGEKREERKVRAKSAKPGNPDMPGRKLSYDEFVASQKDSTSAQSVGESQLMHSGLESVRTILNVIIGRTELQQEEDSDDSRSLILSTGDDEPEDSNSLETNENFNSNEQITPTAVRNTGGSKNKGESSVRDSQRAILKAVMRFMKGINEKVYEEGELSIVELIRLRVILLIILDSGCRESICTEKYDEINVTGVLPSKSENSWKNVAGRLLYPFFRAASTDKPWISYISAEYRTSEVPVDVVEAMVQSLWTVCAMFSARDDDGQSLLRSDTRMNVVNEIYRQTVWLSHVIREDMESTFKSLTERFGEKLGIDFFELMEFHQAFAKKFWPDLANIASLDS